MTGDRVVPCCWRNSAHSGPMSLASDIRRGCRRPWFATVRHPWPRCAAESIGTGIRDQVRPAQTGISPERERVRLHLLRRQRGRVTAEAALPWTGERDLGQVSEPSPEARAAAQEVERLILQTLQPMKPRHRKDGVRITSSIATSVPLRTAYHRALESNDHALVDGLLFNTAGFLSAYMEGRSTLAITPMIATLLAHREKPAEGPWCQALVDTITRLGLIGPNR